MRAINFVITKNNLYTNETGSITRATWRQDTKQVEANCMNSLMTFYKFYLENVGKCDREREYDFHNGSIRW